MIHANSGHSHSLETKIFCASGHCHQDAVTMVSPERLQVAPPPIALQGTWGRTVPRFHAALESLMGYMTSPATRVVPLMRMGMRPPPSLEHRPRPTFIVVSTPHLRGGLSSFKTT